VVPSAEPAPTLTALRGALWEALPGALWPSLAVTVEILPRLPDGRLDVDRLPSLDRPDPGVEADDDPVAALLTAMWAKVAGRPVTPDTSYWQDFSFLQVLAEARQAGTAISDYHVVRCRTPRTLAAALAAASRRLRA
ncbi:MAG: hypothetical protein M3Y04_03175, partial [Actinomycetota bacterium]|nr:hypothetical protein [Actinomycetota bacterium]